MFADPQSVTVNSVAQSLPRTETEGAKSVYTKDDGTYKLTLSHQVTKNGEKRHLARLDFNEMSADPFVPAENVKNEGAAYLVIVEPGEDQITNANLLLKVKGFVAWASDANLTKLIAGES